jgi:hypothetical protein
VAWFIQYEQWGEAAFPNIPKILNEQPEEWIRSVEAMRAAKRHYQSWLNAPPAEAMGMSSGHGEGGIGRGAVGDSV